MRVSIWIVSVFFYFTLSSLSAQINDSLDWRTFRICSPDSNKIVNDEGLMQFYQCLDSLKLGTKIKVNIVHIGDSHIQGDYMSRTVRYRLQAEFGEGGRGLIFPYSLLNMYGPVDYKCSTNVIWENDRIFPREKKYPVGLTGYTLATNNRTMKMLVDLIGPPKNSWGSLENFTSYPSNQFDVVKVFYSNDSNDLPLVVGGVGLNGEMVSPVKLPQYSSFTNTGYQYQQIQFNQTFTKLMLCADSSRYSKEAVQLHGLVFENSQKSGIVYHMAGVGACQLYNFLKSSYFVSQTISIQPNLIIISLGANESVSMGFDSIGYEKKYIDLIETFKREIPGVSILLTTPPDILYKGRLPFSLYPVQNVLKRVAIRTQSALWNLHDVMGGEKSNYIWSLVKYAGPDRIHFSPKGYDFQGLLLTEAIINSYQQHTELKVDTVDLESDLMEYRKKLNAAFDVAVSRIKSSPQDSIELEVSPNRIPMSVETQSHHTNHKIDLSKKRYHVVGKGESIYSISRKYGLNFKDILRINGLTEKSLIRPGQKIRLR